MIDCKPVDCPMNNKKLIADRGEVFFNPKRYKRLVRKLIYLTIPKPNMFFAVGVVSQFM